MNNDQEVIDDEEDEEEEEEGEQKQSANHSSRILVEVPVEVSVSGINIRIIFVVVPLLMVHYTGGDCDILGQFHGWGSEHRCPLVHPQSRTSS